MNKVFDVTAVMPHSFTTDSNLVVKYGCVKSWDGVLNSIDLSFHLREEHVGTYGYPIFTKEVAELLAEFIGEKKVLDVGAGSGYYSAMLNHFGVKNIMAVDNDSWLNHRGWEKYFPVEVDDATNYLRKHSDMVDVVLLSWPPYKESFAENIVKGMRTGQILIYQGESEGGCTGDTEFFEYLDKYLVEHSEVNARLHLKHRQFSGIHDYWNIFVKK